MRAFILLFLLVPLLASCSSSVPQTALPEATTTPEIPLSTSSPISTATARPTIWYTPSPYPTMAIFITPDVIHLTHWKEYEEALTAKLLAWVSPEERLCEWILLGASDMEQYIWAVCREKPNPDGHSAVVSIPAKVYLGLDGKISEIEIPDAGMFYGPSIRRMFPEDVQEKIFHFQEWLDVERLEAHLVYRFEHPGTPPLIVLSVTPAP